MRVAANPLLCLRNSDFLERLQCHPGRCRPADFLVDKQRFHELLFDRHVRIQRGHRILKYHRDAPAANAAQDLLRATQQIDAFQHGAGALDPAGRLRHQAQEREACDRLARPGFTHDTQRFAPIDAKRHSVHCAHDTVARVKGRAQVIDFKQRHAL